jgi:signal transduction histidine kinase/FixJ family two-component response regulator
MRFFSALDKRLRLDAEGSVEVRRKTATVIVAFVFSLLSWGYIALRLAGGGFNNATALVLSLVIAVFSLLSAILLLATRDGKFATIFAHSIGVMFVVGLPAMAMGASQTDNRVYPYTAAPLLPALTSFTLPSHRPMIAYSLVFIVVTTTVWLTTETTEQIADDAPEAALAIMNTLVVVFSLTIFSGVAGTARADSQDAQWQLAAAEAKRDAATAANEAKARFVSILSHELRNPLQAMLLQLEMMQSMKLEPSLLVLVQGMMRAADALASIANDILYVSKIDAGVVRIVSVPVDLRSLVERAAAAVAPELAGRDLELLVDIQPGLDTLVLGDPVRVGQVLSNLLSNALKFTKEGEVEVSVLPLDQPVTEWCIAVRDTGIGMDEEGLSKLFQSFTQVDETTTRRFGGMGLGLFVAKELTSLMGGTISVDSVPDSGSTFTVTLPLPRPTSSPAVVPDVSPAPRLAAAMRRWSVAVVATNRGLGRIVEDQVRYFFSDVGMHQLVRLDRPLDVETRLRSLLRSATPQQPLLVLANYSDLTMSVASLLSASGDASPTSSSCVTVIMAAAVDVAAVTTEGWPWCVAKPAPLATLCKRLTAAVTPLAETAPTPRSPLHHLSPISRSTVLIVDDFAMIRDLVANIVHDMGYETLVAENGAQALSLVRHHYDHISMVLMDCEMPVLDGYEATEGIREFERETDVPPSAQLYVCAMTANAMREDEQKCYARSMSGVLAKPLARADLVRVLTEHAALPADRRGVPQPRKKRSTKKNKKARK